MKVRSKNEAERAQLQFATEFLQDKSSDICTIIAQQHDEIRAVISRMRDGQLLDREGHIKMAKKLRSLIYRHTQIEEAFLYPVLQKSSSHSMYQSLREHLALKECADDLVNCIDHTAAQGRLAALEHTFLEHVGLEERNVLPQVSTAMSRQEKNELSERVRCFLAEIYAVPHDNIYSADE